MSTVKKVVGKIPVGRGAYSASNRYYKENTVTLYGMSFRALSDMEAGFAPATINSAGSVVLTNTDKWQLLSGTPEAYQQTSDIQNLNANTGISEYPAFDPAVDYAVGDVVKNEGLLYRFTVAHEKGEWNAEQVEPWSERKDKDSKISDVKLNNEQKIRFSVSGGKSAQAISSDIYLKTGDKVLLRKLNLSSSQTLLVYIEGNAVNNQQVKEEYTTFTAKASGFLRFQINSDISYSADIHIKKEDSNSFKYDIEKLKQQTTYESTVNIEYDGSSSVQKVYSDIFVKAGETIHLRRKNESSNVDFIAFVEGDTSYSRGVTITGVEFTPLTSGTLSFITHSNVVLSDVVVIYRANERIDSVIGNINAVQDELDTRKYMSADKLVTSVSSEWENTGAKRSKSSDIWVYQGQEMYIRLLSYDGTSNVVSIYVEGDTTQGVSPDKSSYKKFTAIKDGYLKVFTFPVSVEEATVEFEVISVAEYEKLSAKKEGSIVHIPISFEGGKSPQAISSDIYLNEGDSVLLKKSNASTTDVDFLVFIEGNAVNNQQVKEEYTTFTAKASGFLRFQINSDISYSADIYVNAMGEIGREEAVYVSVSGDDSNTGTFNSAFRTVGKALSVSKNVIIRGGVYTENIDLLPCSGIVSIKAYPKEEVIFMNGVIVSKTAGTDEGNGIYSLEIPDPYRKRIWQFGVNDITTLIEEDKRHYLEGRKTHRCDCQHLMRVDNTDELVDNSYCYQDGKVYYKTGVAVSEEHYLFTSSDDDFIVNGSGVELHMAGINVYGGKIRLINMCNAEIRDCAVKYAKVGFTAIDSLGIVLNHCEAAMIDSDLGNVYGDGFTTSRISTHTGEIDYNITSLTMIDCWGHDCWNDGYSSHYTSNVRIIGGVFDFNSIGGAGAGLTPSFGSTDIIIDAIVQDNYQQGFFYTGNGEGGQAGEYGVCQVFGLISRRNNSNGIASGSTKQIVEVKDCVSYDNGGYGYWAYANGCMKAISCKSLNNGKGDKNSNVMVVRLQELSEADEI